MNEFQTQNPEHSPKKRKLLFISLAVVGLAGLCALGFWVSKTASADDAAATIKILPQMQSPVGVPIESTFDLTSQMPLKEETLSSMLQVEPALPFSLEGKRKKWVVTPSQPMLKNTVYTFSIKGDSGQVVQSFAFQTTSDLTLTNIYPNSSYVPLTSSIEVTFNTPDVDLTDAFKIMPEISGKLTTSGYSTTFVPDSPLENNCTYRLTIPAGLTAPNGMVLTNDISYSFTTDPVSGEEKWRYSDLALNGEYAETFLPDDLLVVDMRGGEDVNDVKFQIDIHRYPDINGYANDIRKKDEYYRTRYGIEKDYVTDTSALEKVANLQSTLFVKDDASWSPRYAILPKDLPMGWYIVTIQGTSKTGRPQFVQKQIQITNSSVYVESLRGETLTWVNDPVSGNPMNAATITFENAVINSPSATVIKLPNVTATSDEDGIANAKTGEMSDVYVTLSDGKNDVYFQPSSLSLQEELPLSGQFYSVLYTDRELYLPDDTIEFWGVLSPRKTDFVLPETVKVALDIPWDFSRLYQQDVVVNPDGSFSGSLKITGTKQGYYSLEVSDGRDNHFSLIEPRPSPFGGTSYVSKNLSVSQFKKPPYIITTTNKKNWYYANEEIDFAFETTYFDGTPAGNGIINFSSSELEGMSLQSSVPITLDQRGYGTLSSKYKSSNYENDDYIQNWSVKYLYYNVAAGGSQDAYLETSDTVPIFPSKIACNLESEDSDTLTITTANIDVQKLNSYYEKNTEMWSNPEYKDIAGTPADIPVTVYVKRRDVVKTPIESYYDPIHKETITRYKYDSEEVLVDTIESTTKNGTVTLTGLGANSEDTQSYWFEVVFDGQINGNVQEAKYHYGPYISEGNPTTQYYFKPIDNYDGEYSDGKYPLNAAVPLALYNDDQKEENKGRVFYSVNQHTRIETGIFTEDEKSLTFTEAYVPNARIAGAYFDGRHVYRIEPMSLTFDYDNRILDVDISSDKEKYEPGEKAVITVKLSDKEGKPVAATACVGVVDEAMFALAPQDFNVAEQLYQTAFAPYVQSTASYREYDLSANPNTGGGKGGGGDGGGTPRKDFANTALFQPITIDASGTAQVTLTLPDDITSWRVTVGAVGSVSNSSGISVLKGGSNTSQTIATLPFQIRPIVTDSYLDGDDVSISINSMTSISSAGPAFDSAVNYEVSIRDLSGKAELVSKNITGKVGIPTAINFGKMPLGQYKLTISGKCDTFSDAVELPFSVTQQAPTTNLLKNCSLEELTQVQSLRYPVNITVFDNALSTYMDAISFLSFTSGERTEQLVAAFEASNAFRQLFPEEDRTPITRDARLEDVQLEDGGIKPLPVASSNTETTVKLLLTAPHSMFSTTNAVNYLRKVISSPSVTPDDRIIAYAGLAAVKEPVLIDITRILKQTDLSATQRLTLAAGLAKAGDLENARIAYDEVAASLRKAKEDQIFFSTSETAGETDEEALSQTGAALMLASTLHHPDAEGLAKWTIEQYSITVHGRATMANLELLSYVSNFVMPKTGKGKFSYVQYGEDQTKELGAMGVYSLSLNAEDFAASKFKAVSGDLSASIQYTGVAEKSVASVPGESTENPLISLKKTIIPVGDNLSLFSEAKVELSVQFSEDTPAGCYEISDLIPAGMRYLKRINERDYYSKTIFYDMSSNEGQQVKSYIYYNPDAENGDGIEPIPVPLDSENVSTEPVPEVDPLSYTLTYYVNCTLPGEFVSPPATAYSAENQFACFSEGITVKIPEK